MAEILIAAKDLPTGYKRGDPITVQEDGHTWGRDERPPIFTILEIPGVPVATFRNIILPLRVPAIPGDDEFDAMDESDRFLTHHRVNARFMLDDLPSNVRSELASGRSSVTFAQVRPVLRVLTYSRAKDAVEVSSRRVV